MALASDTVGFVTISLIKVPVIQEIAIAASLGVAAIILTNLGLLPVLLSYVTVHERQRAAARERDRRLEPVWARFAGVARRGPALVTIGLAAVLMILGASHAPKVPHRRPAPRRARVAPGFPDTTSIPPPSSTTSRSASTFSR